MAHGETEKKKKETVRKRGRGKKGKSQSTLFFSLLFRQERRARRKNKNKKTTYKKKKNTSKRGEKKGKIYISIEGESKVIHLHTFHAVSMRNEFKMKSARQLLLVFKINIKTRAASREKSNTGEYVYTRTTIVHISYVY